MIRINGCEIEEPEVLALLIELEAHDLFYEGSFEPSHCHDPQGILPAEGCVDPKDVAKIRRELIKRHAAVLTKEQRAMVNRASAVELEHAGWILQARSFGFHLGIWRDLCPDEEQRVTYRRRSWSPRSGNKTINFTNEEKCMEWVRAEQRNPDNEYLHVQTRPVGAWRGDNTYFECWIDDVTAVERNGKS